MPANYLPVSKKDIGRMYMELTKYITTIKNPKLRFRQIDLGVGITARHGKRPCKQADSHDATYDFSENSFHISSVLQDMNILEHNNCTATVWAFQ